MRFHRRKIAKFLAALLSSRNTKLSLLLIGAIGAPTLAQPLEHSTAVQAVRFVGCPSDGQVGPRAAPKHGRTPQVPIKVAALLNYYSVEGLGVLAPAGWHCMGGYGSSGSEIIVTPVTYRPGDKITGPVVAVTYEFGDTSGRVSVAAAIVRFFPTHRDFLVHVADLDPSYWSGHEKDVIVRRMSDIVEFKTPPYQQGWGTRETLVPSSAAVEGIVKLVPGSDAPDLLTVRTRLPEKFSKLAPLIFAEAATHDGK